MTTDRPEWAAAMRRFVHTTETTAYATRRFIHVAFHVPEGKGPRHCEFCSAEALGAVRD